MKKIRILLADDHQILLDSLKYMLDGVEGFEVVGVAKNGAEVLKCLEAQETNVLILDLNMPGMDGMETTSIVKRKYPGINILILTTNDEGSIIMEILKNGAIGYLFKNTSHKQLIRGIRLAAKGQTVLNDQVTAKMVESMHLNQEKRSRSNTPKITKREREVLQYIAQEYTAKEIAKKLFVSLNTIITHRRNLLMKLEVKNSVGLVRKALEFELI